MENLEDYYADERAKHKEKLAKALMPYAYKPEVAQQYLEHGKGALTGIRQGGGDLADMVAYLHRGA